MPRRLPLLVILGAALVPARGRAEPVVGADDFSPLHEQQLVGLDDFTFDTDWFPMDAAVQLRLIVHGGNTVTISMPGEGLYDWESESIRFVGAEGAGLVRFDVGFTLDAKVRFDVLGIQWESDIIGPYDYAVIAEDGFTPYLLPGNPERPVSIADETDTVTLVSVPVVPDVVVASGNLDIDVYVIVEGELAGQAIEASTEAPSVQHEVIVEEGASAPLLAGPGPAPDPFVVSGVLVCGLMTAPTIVLKPTLVMSILGMDFEIADIEIPVALPVFDDTIRFDAISMSFPRPAPEEPATTGVDSDSDGGSGSGEGGDAPTTGATSQASGSSGEGTDSEGSATAGADPPPDSGCGCRGGGSAPPWLLALVGIGLRRRRGRTRRRGA